MATPAEKKALLFLGIVTLLGGAVRLWRSRSADVPPSVQEPSHAASRARSRASGTHASARSGSGAKPRIPRRSPSKTRETAPPTILVDLDIATISDIEALGVLKPGVARMIVANRDSFGPFGSLRTLSRIPYIKKTTITTLAPLVTFSRVPRPMNAVLSPRADSLPSPTRRRSPSSKHR